MKHAGKLALLVAIVGVLASTLILFGARLGIWEPLTGFGLYRTYFNSIAMIVAAVGLLAVLIHFVRREKSGAAMGTVAAVVGVICLVPMIQSTLNPLVRGAPINDVTTDTANPPEFLILDDTRAGAKTSLVYAGPKVAQTQARVHPDIAPLETDLPAQEAFARALELASDLGWEIVGSDAEALRFEATVRTSVFYFADDAVVVVTSTENGSRVDMRSVSRVGRSDQGVNAARIHNFQQQF
ncbi:DUF1499 domain-containing protein [Planktotalea sp.]|uniref:DUF1499 domain-containing protein n=1 Tax=Planktotalea sp. TaxID=2029877 RepID=UPI003298E3EA